MWPDSVARLFSFGIGDYPVLAPQTAGSLGSEGRHGFVVVIALTLAAPFDAVRGCFVRCAPQRLPSRFVHVGLYLLTQAVRNATSL